MNIDDPRFGVPLQLAHPFESEVRTFVEANQRLLMEALAVEEDVSVDEEAGDLAPAENAARLTWERQWFDERRTIANSLAVVALMTRFQHWLEEFLRGIPQIKLRKSRHRVVSLLLTLNGHLGSGPVAVDFFEELADVRDSFIHADSQARWHYQRDMRTVAAEYVTAGPWRLRTTNSR